MRGKIRAWVGVGVLPSCPGPSWLSRPRPGVPRGGVTSSSWPPHPQRGAESGAGGWPSRHRAMGRPHHAGAGGGAGAGPVWEWGEQGRGRPLLKRVPSPQPGGAARGVTALRDESRCAPAAGALGTRVLSAGPSSGLHLRSRCLLLHYALLRDKQRGMDRVCPSPRVCVLSSLPIDDAIGIGFIHSNYLSISVFPIAKPVGRRRGS